MFIVCFFFSSRRRHTRYWRDWSSDVCSSDLQDEWQSTDKLKLTYGLRLDGIFFDNSDLMTNNAILALDYNGRHIDTGKWPNSSITVSPRFGFTYDVFGNKSLKVRGGTGLFSGRLPLVR